MNLKLESDIMVGEIVVNKYKVLGIVTKIDGYGNVYVREMRHGVRKYQPNKAKQLRVASEKQLTANFKEIEDIMRKIGGSK